MTPAEPRPVLPRSVLALLLGACGACSSPSTSPDEEPTGTYAGKRLLTLEQVNGGEDRPDFAGGPARHRWAPDGVHVLTGRGEETKWIDPLSWTEVTPPDEDAEAESPEVAFEEGDELSQASPDGRWFALVRDNDLVLVHAESGERHRVTTDGGPDVFNGKLDWIYQEELYGRGTFRAFWWSPDSRYVAFLRLDESEVFDFTVVDHIEEGHFRVKPEVTRYPKPGDPNPTAALGIVDVTAPGAPPRWTELAYAEEDEVLLVRVGWREIPGSQGDGSEGSTELVFLVQNRIQTWLDLNLADPATGASRTVLRESGEAWTDRLPLPRWLPDGTFLWLGDREEQRRLERRDASGDLLATLTPPSGSVTRVRHVDPEAGRVWYEGTFDGALNSNLYRVGLDGTPPRRLTSGEGQHSTSFNGDRSLFLDRFSSLTQPASVRLHDGDGHLVREVARAEVPDLEEYLTGEWELHQVRARDGTELDVALLRPVPFDLEKSYAVWLPTYSGPNSPSVRNRWNSSSWYRFLAQNGVIVMQVNVRSASGRGPAATRACYGRLGVTELEDLEDAVGWLTAHPWADAERVGITGGSYGGFMAAFALTHSDDFALGVAGSGVYDWRMYDSIYTERYMQTPELNPEGYAATSVIEAAANLQGHLVITHGTMDDNVHVQNAIQLTYALQKAGKTFDLMLYPESRHGIRDRDLREHVRELEWRAIQEYLLR